MDHRGVRLHRCLHCTLYSIGHVAIAGTRQKVLSYVHTHMYTREHVQCRLMGYVG